MRSARLVMTTLVAVGLPFVASACSSDSKTATSPSTASSSESSSGAPEEHKATAAEVAQGLKDIEAVTQAMVAAGTDKAELKVQDEKIEPIWEEIEGTIKANDQDAYVTFEDNFALLEKAAESGDAGQVKTAADAVSKAVADYLAKYPG